MSLFILKTFHTVSGYVVCEPITGISVKTYKQYPNNASRFHCKNDLFKMLSGQSAPYTKKRKWVNFFSLINWHYKSNNGSRLVWECWELKSTCFPVDNGWKLL
uniref:Uncharacterized protein n=1 Tax=Micrurus lemniscatus lemniscatus TaxID=129467 RepID=A0A2D4H8L8_MICLE